MIIFLLLKAAVGYELINGYGFYNRPIYISSAITPIHRDCITQAVTQFNRYDHLYTPIAISDFKTDETIRIKYSTKRYTGYSKIQGLLNDDNDWNIDKISIGLNPNIDFMNSCVNIMLHELCHCRGLHHSNVEGAFMNQTIKITIDGYVKDMDYPELQLDDINGMVAVEKK